jgi:hypothetical protein
MSDVNISETDMSRLAMLAFLNMMEQSAKQLRQMVRAEVLTAYKPNAEMLTEFRALRDRLNEILYDAERK